MNRRRLYLSLCEEIAQGWPTPWWPQDREAACFNPTPDWLVRYIDRLADVVAEGRAEANVSPDRRQAA